MQEDYWEGICTALRLARGGNRFRGRLEADPSRRRLRLELEAGAGLPPGPWLTIEVGSRPEDVYYLHAGQRYMLATAGDLPAFVEAALHICRRGRTYIRTNDAKADYK